jgi:hypothetical protein
MGPHRRTGGDITVRQAAVTGDAPGVYLSIPEQIAVEFAAIQGGWGLSESEYR